MNYELFDQTRKLVCLMSGKAEEIVKLSTSLIHEFSEETYQRVVDIEEEINQFHLDIDDYCYKFLALQQPMAKDLRYIMAWIRSNTDLERMGDQAINIARRMNMLSNKKAKPPRLLINMIEVINYQVRDALYALANSDLLRLKRVFEDEQRVNQLNIDINTKMLQKIRTQAIDPEVGYEWGLMARDIERIGDHATNLAENVFFIESGADVRHPTTEDIEMVQGVIHEKEQNFSR